MVILQEDSPNPGNSVGVAALIVLFAGCRVDSPMDEGLAYANILGAYLGGKCLTAGLERMVGG
jgi:hypothetical protein